MSNNQHFKNFQPKITNFSVLTPSLKIHNGMFKYFFCVKLEKVEKKIEERFLSDIS